MRFSMWAASLAVVLFLFTALAPMTGCGDDDDAGDDDTGDDDAGDDDIGDDDTGDDDTGDDDQAEDCEEGMDYSEPYPEIVRGPYLQHVTRESIRIVWETDRPANSVIKYGKTPDLGLSACDFTPALHHEAEISFLEEETQYHYIVRSDGAQSPDYTFVTAPRPQTPFTFAVYGDSRSLPENHRIVADGMLEIVPDFVINVGDIVADGLQEDQYDPQFFDPAAELMAHAPMYVSIGNHEKEAEYYYHVLSLPGNEAYYSFTYGNVRFIALDTNRLYFWGTPQYAWFEEELITARAQGMEWIVAFAHHPAYSEGWDSPGYDGEGLMRSTLVPLMEQYGLDLFLCGHTHDYERGHLNGVTHIITGGGGAPLDSFQQDFEHIVVYESDFHYVEINVSGKTMDITARYPDGESFDHHTLQH